MLSNRKFAFFILKDYGVSLFDVKITIFCSSDK